MEENRKKALAAALGQIEKQFGKGSVMRLGDAGENYDVESVSTGSLGLDIALGIGGLPRGRVVEIYGPESSGKTTLTLQVIAEAHDRALAELLFDLPERGGERLLAVFFHRGDLEMKWVARCSVCNRRKLEPDRLSVHLHSYSITAGKFFVMPAATLRARCTRSRAVRLSTRPARKTRPATAAARRRKQRARAPRRGPT